MTTPDPKSPTTDRHGDRRGTRYPRSEHASRHDHGGATVELVLVVPVLVLMIMIVIQFGLYWHATHVAQAAAAEGVRAARLADSTATAGQARAERFVTAAAPTLLHDVTITATRNADHATVDVRASVQAVVPGLDLTVDAQTTSPVERFRTRTR